MLKDIFSRSKLKFTRQFDQMDCGAACIRMIASCYGKDYPLSYLRTLSHLTREGVSVAGIRDALDKIGAESRSFEMTLEQLREKCPLPAILHWEQNHFVVLESVDRSKLTGHWHYKVANPAYGATASRKRLLRNTGLTATRALSWPSHRVRISSAVSLSRKSTASCVSQKNTSGLSSGRWPSRLSWCS